MATRRTKVAAIPDVGARVPREINTLLIPIKDILDLREGRKGNYLDRYVLFHDLVELGLTTASGTAASSTSSAAILLIDDFLVGATDLYRYTPAALDDTGLLVAADTATELHALTTIGLMFETCASGAKGNVQRVGAMTNVSWTWTAGLPVFLGASGTLTQTVPSSGFHLQLGVAKSAVTLFLDVQEAVML